MKECSKSINRRMADSNFMNRYFSGNGIVGQIIESIESEEVINSDIIMIDKDGNTLLKINSTKIKI